MSKLCTGLAVAVASVLGFAANAAHFNYDESIDGEIGFYEDVFDLTGYTSATISGTASYVPGGFFDSDSFYFAIIDLSQFYFNVLNGVQSGGAFTAQAILVGLVPDPTKPFQDWQPVTLTHIERNVSDNSLAYAAGPGPLGYLSSVHAVRLGLSALGSAPDETTTLDYKWRIDLVTAQVPLPPTLAGMLLAAGATVALAGLSRRSSAVGRTAGQATDS